MVDSAADTSTLGELESRYSPTSCERNSYETVVRSGGRISIFPRRIRILPSSVRGQNRAYEQKALERHATNSDERARSERLHSINIETRTDGEGGTHEPVEILCDDLDRSL